MLRRPTVTKTTRKDLVSKAARKELRKHLLLCLMLAAGAISYH